MSVMGLFFVFIATIAAWWLVRQGVTQSPWLEEGEVTGFRGYQNAQRPPAAKVGLGVFLAVASCLFSLLTAAFYMRMDAPDWQSPPPPAILAFNTVILIASSLALHFAKVAADDEDGERLKLGLAMAGGCAALFLLGQLWAWRELIDLGYFASTNPANAFFYLLTGAHALHLMGGLVALARTSRAAWYDPNSPALSSSVELCALYWHFLLFVWFLLYAMLAGWTDGLGVICRRLLS
jgi:cytochrome c oxidase subunit III